MLKIAYVYDSDLKMKANQQGKNYWYEYIKEIFEQLGLRAREVSRNSLRDEKALNEVDTLIIGNLPQEELSNGAKANLENWVRNGGVLIGLATEGLDFLFGNICSGVFFQPSDEYTLSGYFDLKNDPLTEGVHSYLHPSQKLLIFSPIRKIIPKDSKEIARLYRISSDDDTGYAAITKREYNSGCAYYFAFDVCQTIWVLHQGRPVTRDMDGDGYYRTFDLMVIGDNEPEVLYADEILYLLQNMIGQKRQPFIYQIPPENGKIPSVLFYWGGDDEGMKGAALKASEWMKTHGLPYHINVLYKDGKFTLKEKETKAILNNGHEISLHYNFIDGYSHPNPFTQSHVQAQAKAFFENFGWYPVCSVNHWATWIGWEQPAEWMSSAGGQADNSFIPRRMESSLSLDLEDAMGFSFGTGYPFYFYHDYRRGNKRIDFLEMPITCYELGYTKESLKPESIYKAIDIATHYHLVMNFFYHPPRVSSILNCQKAIEEILKYIETKGIIVKHMAPDGVCKWWKSRSRSKVSDVDISEHMMRFNAYCEYKEGMIVKIPLSDRKVCSVTSDSGEIVFENKKEFGQYWVYVVCPPGLHEIKVRIS